MAFDGTTLTDDVSKAWVELLASIVVAVVVVVVVVVAVAFAVVTVAEESRCGLMLIRFAR